MGQGFRGDSLLPSALTLAYSSSGDAFDIVIHRGDTRADWTVRDRGVVCVPSALSSVRSMSLTNGMHGVVQGTRLSDSDSFLCSAGSGCGRPGLVNMEAGLTNVCYQNSLLQVRACPEGVRQYACIDVLPWCVRP